MKLTDKRFWIAWLLLFILAIVSCMTGGWSEDTALLGAAYTLSLLSFKVLLSFFDLCTLLLYELEISL